MLYNLDELREIADGDDEMFMAVIEQFYIDVPIALESMKKALLASDCGAIRFNSHRMKPAIHHLQITSLKNIIYEVEDKAYNNIIDDVLVLQINQLDEVLGNVIKQLKSEFK